MAFIKRLVLSLSLSLSLVQAVAASGVYPLSQVQQFDANGKPLAGARLYLFNGGSTTPRTGYKDSALTSPHPNPIVTDSAGRIPLVFLDDGIYRQRLTTKTGTLIFDNDGVPVLSTAAGGAGTSVDPDSIFKTGDFKIAYDDQPSAGFVRANGRTIGSASSGATERANADTQPLYEKYWAFSNISVVGGKGVSAVADFAANKPLVLPDAAGRGLFAMDDLGAGAKSRITSATCSGATSVGTGCGSETVTQTQAQLPSYSLTGGTGTVSATGTTGTESATHTHTFSGVTSGQSADHSHSFTALQSTGISVTAGASSQAGQQSTNSTGGSSNDHTHSYSGTTATESATHTHTVTVTGAATGITILSGGSGGAMPNMPPALLVMILIRL
jgi:hypothetical protein